MTPLLTPKGSTPPPPRLTQSPPQVQTSPNRERTSCTRTDFSSRPLRRESRQSGGHVRPRRESQSSIRRSAPLPRPDSRPRPDTGRHAGSRSPRAQRGPASALHRRGLAGGGLSLRLARHSHSMVPGGLLVQSSTTRLTSGTELVIRLEIRARTS